MRTLLPLSVVALSVVGCATQSEPTETANAEAARERCDTVLTGSRIPQCNRGDVKVITREEIERDPTWLQKPEIELQPPKR
jgi:hypothetical protein